MKLTNVASLLKGNDHYSPQDFPVCSLLEKYLLLALELIGTLNSHTSA